MSDLSDDDFANNYEPTTPAPAAKKARGARAGGKPVAGPSTRPAAARVTITKIKPANGAGPTIEPADDEDDDVVMVDEPPAKKRKASDDSDEVVAVPGPPRGAAKKSAARPEPAVNGAPKSKGKAKAEPPPKGARANGVPAEVVEEQDSAIELDDAEEPTNPPVQRAVRGGSKQPKTKNGPPPPARPSRTEAKLARELDSLRVQLEQSREVAKEITNQRDKLAKQLEEVFRLRNTEPEGVLQEYKGHLESSIRRKDSLIEELTAQLSKLQTSSKSDKSYTLQFLTREAAEEEKQALREENIRLKEVIKQREATIASKDKQMHALEDEAKTAKKDLELEIERSKTLAARAPPSAMSRQQKPTPAEVQNTPVIKLYEDMTNILITSVKVEKSPEYPTLDEHILTCIYTYQNTEEHITFCKSLNFTLRHTYDRPEGATPGADLADNQLVQKVKYEPKDLDKENPELVERLAFFNNPFMFARDQMTVFLKTLTDTVAGVFEPDAEPGMDDSHEVIVLDG
ncbi:hypothetical protein VTO73DRAFT_10167 [Trametes versicolor]